MDKEQVGVLLRAFWMIILPLIISYFILFNPSEKIQLSKEKITENVTMVRVSEDEVFRPSFENTIRDIFEVPFDLRWYDICFVNKDSKMVYENGETDKNVNITLNFNNNQKIVTVPYGETKCVLYKFNKDFTYNWEFSFPINLSKILETSKEKVIPINETHFLRERGISIPPPSVDSYAKPEGWGIFVKTILFVLAWNGLTLLLFEIKDYIQFGREKKKKKT